MALQDPALYRKLIHPSSIHAEKRRDIADGPGQKTGPIRYELRGFRSDIAQRCALVKPAASAASSVVNHTSAMVRS